MRSTISSAWLADEVPESIASSTFDRYWDALASAPRWQAWLAEHMTGRGLVTIVNVEERPAKRVLVRGDSLYYYLPASSVREAHAAHRLAELAIEIHEEVYAKWAQKRDLPPPPVGEVVAAPSRLP